MDQTPVSSSNVDSVGYDDQAEELHVTFLNGRIYVYHGVSSKTYDSFMASRSKGEFLHRYIKGRHMHTRVK
jgi:hypothetical protein